MDPNNLGLGIGSFDFSLSGLFSGFLFGVIGMYLFKVAKQSANFPLVGIAILLMIYPYFTSGPLLDWGVGIALCVGAYYLPK